MKIILNKQILYRNIPYFIGDEVFLKNDHNHGHSYKIKRFIPTHNRSCELHLVELEVNGKYFIKTKPNRLIRKFPYKPIVKFADICKGSVVYFLHQPNVNVKDLSFFIAKTVDKISEKFFFIGQLKYRKENGKVISGKYTFDHQVYLLGEEAFGKIVLDQTAEFEKYLKNPTYYTDEFIKISHYKKALKSKIINLD